MKSQFEDRIRDLYRIPCGPTEISADSICRKSLKDSMDRLLDRVIKEINPVDNSEVEVEIPKEETEEDLKIKLINRGKMKAEVKAIVKEYEEELQGNSKLLQDISGRIETWGEMGKTDKSTL